MPGLLEGSWDVGALLEGTSRILSSGCLSHRKRQVSVPHVRPLQQTSRQSFYRACALAERIHISHSPGLRPAASTERMLPAGEIRAYVRAGAETADCLAEVQRRRFLCAPQRKEPAVCYWWASLVGVRGHHLSHRRRHRKRHEFVLLRKVLGGRLGRTYKGTRKAPS